MKVIFNLQLSPILSTGLAIQFGAIGDVGVLAESGISNIDNVGGTKPQGFVSCLNVLDKFMCRIGPPVVCTYIPSEKLAYDDSQAQVKRSLTMAVLRILGKYFSLRNPHVCVNWYNPIFVSVFNQICSFPIFTDLDLIG